MHMQLAIPKYYTKATSSGRATHTRAYACRTVESNTKVRYKKYLLWLRYPYTCICISSKDGAKPTNYKNYFLWLRYPCTYTKSYTNIKSCTKGVFFVYYDFGRDSHSRYASCICRGLDQRVLFLYMTVVGVLPRDMHHAHAGVVTRASCFCI